jgi:hypothetical protein
MGKEVDFFLIKETREIFFVKEQDLWGRTTKQMRDPVM